ncbi:three-Cys-motif partner protein TcmP [Peribacillus tepidiphilus]|uniref:three-Cys-motif partner protein TcmP n=1 Tax=Peribacillus tepidiphilus TaxID=2652445 RepID=UPI00129171C6|nr:three-Cys-motif partner protein TcmP [Peribacillus tepidiphilus]
MAYGEHYDEIGQWSVDKLKFIEDYLPHYLRATKKAYHRYYIDCFAGKGKWIHKDTKQIIDGSPAISMKYKDQFTKLFYIEMDTDRCKSLEELVKENNCINAEIINGDCNIEIEGILNRIHPRAPTFVFVDPSADQVSFLMMEKLSKWKTELFILFPYQMTIRRYLPVNIKSLTDWGVERLNKFFGTNEWINIYKTTSRNYLLDKMLKFYTNRLKDLGYEYIHISDVFKVHGGPDLYMMIWVGKHPVGEKIMRKVYENQKEQLSLF